MADDGSYKTIGTGGGSGAYAEVNHGTSDTTFTLTPNTFHVWDEVASLDLSFANEQAGVANEYIFQFTSGATATSLTLPDSIKYVNDSSPVIAENKIYQISILKGLGAILEFDNSVSLIENKITVSSSGHQYVVTSQYPVASDVKVSLYTVDGTVNCTINSGSSVTYAISIGPIADPDPRISNVEPSFDSTYIYSYL